MAPSVRQLGAFFIGNRLNGSPNSTSSKRRNGIDVLPPPPVTKRRKKELSPLDSPVPAKSGDGPCPKDHDSHRSESISDSIAQFSPVRRRFSSSNQSSSTAGNRGIGTNLAELRHVERNMGLGPRNRRRRKRSLTNSPSISHPRLLDTSLRKTTTDQNREEDVLIEDDAESVAEVASPPPAATKSLNTNLAIILSENPKLRFRDRMNKALPGPQGAQQNSTKRPLFAVKHDNDSVDELSTEYFSDRPAKRPNRGRTTARPASAEESRGPLSSPVSNTAALPQFVKEMIRHPAHVKAAFRYPSHVLLSGKAAQRSDLLSMTVDPRRPHILASADTARAERRRLFWLQVDLQKVRRILWNNDSPFMVFQFPQQEQQGEPLGSTLGLRLYAAEDASRLIMWARSISAASFAIVEKPM